MWKILKSKFLSLGSLRTLLKGKKINCLYSNFISFQAWTEVHTYLTINLLL